MDRKAEMMLLVTLAAPAETVPLLSTVTVETILDISTSLEHVATRTTILYDVSTLTTTINGAFVATWTTTRTEGLQVVVDTTTEVLNVPVTIQTVVVNTVGVSTIPALDSMTQTSAGAISTTPTPSQPRSAVIYSSQPEPSNTSSVTGSSVYEQSSDGGLSKAQQAAIGIGVSLGVVALVALILLLLRWSKKRQDRGQDDQNEKTMALSQPAQTEDSPQRLPEIRKPEELTHPAYEMANPRLSHPSHTAGPTIHYPPQAEPLYLGIPSHMSGAKRWSKEKSNTG